MRMPTSTRHSMGCAVSRQPEGSRWMSKPNSPARAHNHPPTPRKYTAGQRRFSVYWTWSYPWEANRDTTEMDNRFSTMTEVRRVAWPAYEPVEFWQKMFLEGIVGTLG